MNLTKIHLIACALSIIMGCSSDESQPPLEEEIELGTPTSIQVFDIGNEANSSDIRLFFTAGDNSSEVGEYRVILSKNANSNILLEDALSIASDRYYSFTIGGSFVRTNIEESILDSDGDEIQNGVSYKLNILALPTDEALDPVLSQASSSFTLSNQTLKDVYVSSNATNSVELFDGVTGEHLKSFVSANSGGLSQTQEVIFLDDGSLIVTGLGASAIKRYDGSTGSYLGDFTSGYQLNGPTKTNIGPDGNLYVSQWNQGQNAVVRFDGETGEFMDEVVPAFFNGMDQAWDSEGNFYVVSWGLGELRKYDSDFNLLGSTTSNLNGPVNIWISSNTLFIIDWSDGNVKRFNTDLQFMDTFITVGSRIEGYMFDGNEVYICDWAGSKVNVYDRTSGSFLRTFASSSRIQEANGISFGPDQRP